MFRDYKAKSGRTFMLSSNQYDFLEKEGQLDELKDCFFAQETAGRLKNVKRRFRAFIFYAAAAAASLGISLGQGVSADLATKGRTKIFFDSIKTEQNTNENLDNEFRNTLKKLKFLGVKEKDIEPMLLALPTQEQRIAYLNNLADNAKIVSSVTLISYVALYAMAVKCLKKYNQRLRELSEIEYDWAMEDIPNSMQKEYFGFEKNDIIEYGKVNWCEDNGINPMHQKFNVDFQIIDEQIRPIAANILSDHLGIEIGTEEDYHIFCEVYNKEIQNIIEMVTNLIVKQQLEGDGGPITIKIDKEVLVK